MGRLWHICVIALAGAAAFALHRSSDKPGTPALPAAVTATSMQEPSPHPGIDSTGAGRLLAPIPAPVAAHYNLGQSVEIERNGFWRACQVTRIDSAGSNPAIGADCAGIPERSRPPSQEYIRGRSLASMVRPATGRLGSDLSIGKITCYDGSGNRDDVSLLVTDWGQYTDFWGAGGGSFRREGADIVFEGGGLHGRSGREFINNGFKLDPGIACSGALG